MAQLTILAVVALATSAAAWFHEGTVQNQFIVTYNIIPDPFHYRNFVNMPRTINEALFEDELSPKWGFYANRPQDNTTMYCRWTDYRMCLLFDQKESIAGIRLSVKQSDLMKSGLDLTTVPEWEKNWDPTVRQDLYSATVYFQSKEELLAGGRTLRDEDLTAPNGVYILQTDANGVETNRLHVPTAQAEAGSAGFTEQSCFYGMGKHYFQEMYKDGTCEAHRPYFTLYGPKTKTLNGFGFVQYGKISASATDSRNWFENPPAKVAKMIAPNSPDCLEDWVNNVGLFTMHVYFVSDPYFTAC